MGGLLCTFGVKKFFISDWDPGFLFSIGPTEVYLLPYRRHSQGDEKFYVIMELLTNYKFDMSIIFKPED